MVWRRDAVGRPGRWWWWWLAFRRFECVRVALCRYVAHILIMNSIKCKTVRRQNKSVVWASSDGGGDCCFSGRKRDRLPPPLPCEFRATTVVKSCIYLYVYIFYHIHILLYIVRNICPHVRIGFTDRLCRYIGLLAVWQRPTAHDIYIYII